MVRWVTPSACARRLTARASAADSRRSPWSTVTAMSFGPRLRARRQRAASTISAVESGPPETAATRVGAGATGSTSVFASAAEPGAVSSATDTLLFSLDALLHARRCARVLAQDLAERRAGRLLLAERGERLSEAQQRIGCLAGGFKLGRDVEEHFRRVAKALPLEQAFAQPIVGIAGQPIAGMLAQEVAEAFFRQRVIPAQHVPVGEVVFVARALRRRQRGGRRAPRRHGRRGDA